MPAFEVEIDCSVNMDRTYRVSDVETEEEAIAVLKKKLESGRPDKRVFHDARHARDHSVDEIFEARAYPINS